MKALVTGASGFIGGWVVEELKKAGHEPYGLVRPTSDTRVLDELGAPRVEGDVTDRASLEHAAKGMDAVIHTAALVSSYGGWEHYRRVGVEGTRNAVEAARAAGVPRFIHLSSIAVYGMVTTDGLVATEDVVMDEDPQPWNHYVREKVLSEKIVWRAHEAGKIQATTLRPSVVLGPRDRNVVTRFMRLLKLPITGVMGSGKNRVPCVVVDELARAVVEAATRNAAVGKAYNLSGKKTITQRELVRIVAKEVGRPVWPIGVPRPLADLSGAVSEAAYRAMGVDHEPPFTRLAVAILGYDYRIDTTRASRDLGWKGEGDYEAALRKSVRWYRAHR